jgi:hypothetical protein
MFLVPLKTNLPPTTRIAPPFSQLYSHDFRIETIRYPRRISLLIEALDQCSPRSSLETLLFRKELSRWSIPLSENFFGKGIRTKMITGENRASPGFCFERAFLLRGSENLAFLTNKERLPRESAERGKHDR